MATYIPLKKFITFPRVIRAFHSVAKVVKAVRLRPAYSRVLVGKSRVAGEVDCSSTSIKAGLPALRKNGRKV